LLEEAEGAVRLSFPPFSPSSRCGQEQKPAAGQRRGAWRSAEEQPSAAAAARGSGYHEAIKAPLSHRLLALPLPINTEVSPTDPHGPVRREKPCSGLAPAQRC